MKKIYGFAFAAAVMALASCSNETEPVNPNPAPEGAPTGYVAFHIATPNSTRAGSDDGFDSGEGYERNAKSATFLFFGGTDGHQTQAPQTIALTFTSTTGETGISDISDPVIAVSGRNNDQPNKAVVILNCPESLNFNGKTLSEVLAMPIANAVDAMGDDEEGAFMMSNAAYFVDKDATTATIATDLTGKVFQDKADADKEANRVNIYVERLAAKIQLGLSSASQGADPALDISSTKIDVNGAGKLEIVPKITGVTIANKAKTMNLVKQVNDAWNALEISDPGNFRVNWAVTPDNTALENSSYTKLTSGKADDWKWENELVNPIYVRENTLENQVSEDEYICKKTSVLLTAQLQVKAEDGTLSDLAGLVRWAGIYYTPAQFKVQACNFLNDYYVDKEETDPTDPTKKVTVKRNFATPDMLKYVETDDRGDVDDLKQYEAYLVVDKTLLPATTVYVKAGDTYTEVNAEDLEKTLNTVLEDKDNQFWYWTNGYSYYFVEIAAGNKEYTPDGAEEASSEFEYGVVRNNSYDITLKTLGGLGVPVYNPDEDIIPQKPKEKLWYVGATVNILKWRMVSQEANFKDEW